MQYRGGHCRRPDADEKGVSKGDVPGRPVMRAKTQARPRTSNQSNLPSATQLPLPVSSVSSRTESTARPTWSRRNVAMRGSPAAGQPSATESPPAGRPAVGESSARRPAADDSCSKTGGEVGTAFGGIAVGPTSGGAARAESAEKRGGVEVGTGSEAGSESDAAGNLGSYITVQVAPKLPRLLTPKLGAPGRPGLGGFALPPPLPKEESEDSSSDDDDSDGDGDEGGVAEPPKPAPPAGVPDVALLDAGVMAALARVSASRREQDVAAPKPFASPRKLPAGPFAPKPGPPGPGRGGRLGFALPPPLPKKESEDSSSDDDDDSDGDGGGVAEPPNPKPAPPAGVPDVALLHAGVMAALARANLSREGEMTLFSKT